MAATRARLLSALNGEHAQNVADILAAYAGIVVAKDGARKATTSFVTGPDAVPQTGYGVHAVRATDLELTDLTVSFRHPALDVDMTKPIALDCPAGMTKCESWEDVHKALIHMAQKAAHQRGVSSIVLKGVDYPTSFGNIVLIGLVAMLAWGCWYGDLLYAFFSSVTMLNWLTILKPYHVHIAVATLVTHLVETYVFLRPRLQRHRVNIDDTIEWYLFALLDGYPTVRRFDARVARVSPDSLYWKL